MAQVTLSKVTKRWGTFVGVQEFDLEIADREFLVLLGPSGCGKTTTMRMIAGLEEPSEGEIWIGARMVNDDLPKDRDVAMVFQNYGLYPHMSVRENIAYPLKVRGRPKDEIRQKVEAVAAKVQLSGESVQAYQLGEALRAVQGAARAMREFLEYLDRNPEALLKGKKQ